MSIIPGESISDKSLVTQVLNGDKLAFGVLVRQTEALVVQVIYKMIDNAEDRRDLAQEVYLKVYRGLPGFQFNSKLSTWIAQIAYNSCFNHLEKKKLVLMEDLTGGLKQDDSESGSFVETIAVAEAMQQQILQRKQLSEILQRCLQSLPPLYRTLVTLFHQEELSYEEIMQKIGGILHRKFI